MTICHIITSLTSFILSFPYKTKGYLMIEIVILFSTFLLIGLVYELTTMQTREWGENSKHFF